MFKDWTQYLNSKIDLFYANGTISYKQVNNNYGFYNTLLPSFAAIAEWPSLVKSIFLT